MPGFNIRVNCKGCGQVMNPANLAKHRKACALNIAHAHLFNEQINTRQFKSFRRVLSSYGLTVENYIALVKKQDGKCAICSGQPTNWRRLGVDHDHNTGRVRGLLCNRCNSILGLCEDRPDVLKLAIKYLKGQ